MTTPISQQLQSSTLSTQAARRVTSFSDSRQSSESDTEPSDAERDLIRRLRDRDREVRAHEAAHVSAGGPYVVSGPSYTFQAGPDGRSYAIGGRVQLDTSEVAGDPQATLRKAEQVRRAALAPVEPSPQDLRVAAQASDLAAQARVDIAVERRQQQQDETATGSSGFSSRNTLTSRPGADQAGGVLIDQYA